MRSCKLARGLVDHAPAFHGPAVKRNHSCRNALRRSKILLTRLGQPDGISPSRIGSTAIKEIKTQINTTVAHANLISSHNTFRPDYEAGWFSAPFFDIENEHHVKTDLWMIGNVALTLMQFFYEINESRNSIKFVDNFWPSIQTLGQKNDALRAEMMSTDRFKQAMAKEAARKKGLPADAE